jgi:hypothetical protein
MTVLTGRVRKKPLVPDPLTGKYDKVTRNEVPEEKLAQNKYLFIFEK